MSNSNVRMHGFSITQIPSISGDLVLVSKDEYGRETYTLKEEITEEILRSILSERFSQIILEVATDLEIELLHSNGEKAHQMEPVRSEVIL